MRAEYEKGSQEDPSDNEDESENENDSSSESSDQGSNEEMANINSDPEEMNSGRFFEHISYETKRAEKERKLLLTHMKSKHIAGSIFFDQVKRVVAAIQRETGKFDYLIEWKYSKRHSLTPQMSIVKGSHFVFAKPLLYRRYIEEAYLEQGMPTPGN